MNPRDVAIDEGLPITRMAPTIVDCLRLLGRGDAQAFLDRALQQGWITMDEFVARTSARVGRPGAPRLVSLMRLVRSGERASSERLLTRLLRRARITGWSAFQRGRERQNRLVAEGWRVLRFTWRDLTERPDGVVASIATLIATSRTNA